VADDIIARLVRLGEDIECEGDDTCTVCAAMQEIRQLRDRADEFEDTVRWYLEALDETRRPCAGSEAADLALDLHKAEKKLRVALTAPDAPKLAQVVDDLQKRVGRIEKFTLSMAMQRAVKR